MNLPFCNVCGRPLKNAHSIAQGIGPVCAGRQSLQWSDECQALAGVMRDDVTLQNADGCAITNVPWSCKHHSPTGFAWGYAGSGPADLALNILNAFCPPGTDGAPPVKCWQGYASATAMALHQDFKREFLESMPFGGGVIRAEKITAWLQQRARPMVAEQQALAI